MRKKQREKRVPRGGGGRDESESPQAPSGAGAPKARSRTDAVIFRSTLG